MIKINFVDFWPGFENNNLFYTILKKYFDVILDDDPDFLFYSVYGNKHLKFNDCVKIQFTGENLVPDFNLCDYALGFHYLEIEDRYMRFPLFVYYYWYYELVGNHLIDKNIESKSIKEFTDRKFCNFVYSNNVNSHPIRDKFFLKLSDYKRIDSGGRHLNNIGGPIADKMKFISEYKFTISIENSAVVGYTTEKLIEPLLAKSLPIYFGNPRVSDDFNTDAMILIRDEDDLNRAIEEVIVLDQSNEDYLKKLNADIFEGRRTIREWEEYFVEFIAQIFNNGKLNFKRSKYGFSSFYFDELVLMNKLLVEKRKKNKIKSRMKSFFKGIG